MSELRERIQTVIDNEPVALFMKGTPQFIMCGNSDRALRALRTAGAPVTTVDILPDPSIRQELSAVSGWPTIPQVFVNGELIGGADIVEELAAGGKLTGVLEEKLGGDYRASAEEREWRERRKLVERGPERMDVMQDSAGDNHVEETGLVELFECDLTVERSARRSRVDCEDVVAGRCEGGRHPTLAAAADFEHAD